MQSRRDPPNRGYSNPNKNPLIKTTHLTNQKSPKLQRQPSLLPIITKNYTTKNTIPETQDHSTSSLPTEKETVTTPKSFAKTVENSNFPKKDQAIIIDITDEINQKDYVFAIAKIVDPSNIIFISRISKDRYCIFLSSRELVDKIVNHIEPILCNNIPIKIRKYFNPDKRVIISNVCPLIPHDIIIDELRKLNITPTSKITCLRAGIPVEGFNHILKCKCILQPKI